MLTVNKKSEQRLRAVPNDYHTCAQEHLSGRSRHRRKSVRRDGDLFLCDGSEARRVVFEGNFKYDATAPDFDGP